MLFKQSYQIAYRPLVEVEFYFVSKHLPDDSDKFADTVPKSIVMRPAFSHLGIIICLEAILARSYPHPCVSYSCAQSKNQANP